MRHRSHARRAGPRGHLADVIATALFTFAIVVALTTATLGAAALVLGWETP